MDKECLFIDQKGYDRLTKEIEQLREELNRINRERSSHKRGTEAEFAQLEGAVRTINNVIYMNEKILRNAVIIERNNQTDTVDLDDILRLHMTYVTKDDYEEEELFIKLVGNFQYDDSKPYEEASINSSVGSAIYGKKIGEEVSYKVGKRTCHVKILEKLSEVPEKTVGHTKQLKK